MASFWSFLAILMALMVILSNGSLVLESSSQQNMQVSTISAAPASLPGAHLVSPTHSPDIEPLFPTPVTGGLVHSPSYSSLPTIPSSPSPPNPDVLSAPGTVLAYLPSEAFAFQHTYQPLYSILCLTLPVIHMMWLHVL